MIGDGASDLATRPVVDLFVGFGGIVSREKVKNGADIFVSVNSLAPILVFAAGPAGYTRLVNTPYKALFDKGLALAQETGVMIQNVELQTAFKKAFEIT
jgi:phosphoserine phosphatase